MQTRRCYVEICREKVLRRGEQLNENDCVQDMFRQADVCNGANRCQIGAHYANFEL